MILGGIQKNSFIDYPGKISCVLFLAGCNFKCPYCHNPELVIPTKNCRAFKNENSVLDFLEKRKGLLDAVVISGGEPTLQKDLVSFCDRLKKMGYPVKVDTNGSRPHMIRRLIQNRLVDYIAMDIKTEPKNYFQVAGVEIKPDVILESIRIIMDSDIDYEFRTTCIKPLINEKVIEKISILIQGSSLYALQRFIDHKVLQPEFFQNNTAKFSPQEMICLKSIAESRVRSCVVR